MVDDSRGKTPNCPLGEGKGMTGWDDMERTWGVGREGEGGGAIYGRHRSSSISINSSLSQTEGEK